jgi:hypothetical protein
MHVGLEVQDLQQLVKRLAKAGYVASGGKSLAAGYIMKSKNGAKWNVYVDDDDGLSWEFVQYFSDKDELRNDGYPSRPSASKL